MSRGTVLREQFAELKKQYETAAAKRYGMVLAFGRFPSHESFSKYFDSSRFAPKLLQGKCSQTRAGIYEWKSESGESETAMVCGPTRAVNLFQFYAEKGDLLLPSDFLPQSPVFRMKGRPAERTEVSGNWLCYALAQMNAVQSEWHIDRPSWLPPGAKVYRLAADPFAYCATVISTRLLPILPKADVKKGKRHGAAGDRVKRKRHTKTPTRQRAAIKILAGLMAHHEYNNGACNNTEPVVLNRAAKGWRVSAGSLSKFLKDHFDGYDAYVGKCNRGEIAAELKRLNDEYVPRGTVSLADNSKFIIAKRSAFSRSSLE